jgi:hypothetical protein
MGEMRVADGLHLHNNPYFGSDAAVDELEETINDGDKHNSPTQEKSEI